MIGRPRKTSLEELRVNARRVDVRMHTAVLAYTHNILLKEAAARQMSKEELAGRILDAVAVDDLFKAVLDE